MKKYERVYQLANLEFTDTHILSPYLPFFLAFTCTTERHSVDPVCSDVHTHIIENLRMQVNVKLSTSLGHLRASSCPI